MHRSNERVSIVSHHRRARFGTAATCTKRQGDRGGLGLFDDRKEVEDGIATGRRICDVIESVGCHQSYPVAPFSACNHDACSSGDHEFESVGVGGA